MTLALVVLAVLSCAFAAYQMVEARRWRDRASEADALRVRALTAEAQVEAFNASRAQWDEKFRALAADTLHSNSQMLLDRNREQMQSVVGPVAQTLQQFQEHVRKLETERVGAYQSLSTQVAQLAETQERLRLSADGLKNALRSPVQRGRWGEIQLRRVVEMAGMMEFCDFDEQKTLFGETNARPDLIVRMPNDCRVVIDSKVPLEAYLRAMETQDETERSRLLAEHAKQVKAHLKSLGEKGYWDRLPCSPEFVVAFLPSESLFSAALESDPALLEVGLQRRVIVSTPTTLITLLLTVAHGWRQHALSENAERIRQLGVELYDRISVLAEHFSKLGNSITKTVTAYNDTVASMERNLLSSARKFKELKPASSSQVVEVEPVNRVTREIEPGKWGVASLRSGQC